MEPKLTKEQEAQLKKPLPPEAVSQHPTRTYLSTIKPIYVIERFNDVFGIGSWTLSYDVIERESKMVVIGTTFEVPAYGIVLRAFGGNDNDDRGDAYKGAVTDAITKIGSFLGVGMDVFKGLGDKNAKPAAAKSKTTKTSRQTTLTRDVEPWRVTEGDLRGTKEFEDKELGI